MSEEKFLTEKNKAMASGGPIDKFDLKLSQFDIQKAFNKQYCEKVESQDSSEGEIDELAHIQKTLSDIGGGYVQPKYQHMNLREIN